MLPSLAPAGPAGPAGPPGPAGPAGPALPAAPAGPRWFHATAVSPFLHLPPASGLRKVPPFVTHARITSLSFGTAPAIAVPAPTATTAGTTITGTRLKRFLVTGTPERSKRVATDPTSALTRRTS